ncbi:hypothetical protein [Aeoliella mucimassa]|uniref:Uncharacterized protein n=1 Tax=Aeoliella mucimassa TaxID=2527972 RepID=A0A518ATX7_9BACT|nr:hypothetical protein [Aeoliella mucimassa]QDU58191.1 hypothetical protein Pan181_44240 [Aeoliella mucimassa]
MKRLYPRPPKQCQREPFTRATRERAKRIGRDEAERLLREHLPNMAEALLATWPAGEPIGPACEAALLGIVEDGEL